MNKRDAYADGRDRGLRFSDVEITKEQEKEVKKASELSSGELNALQDSLFSSAYEAEENDRQFSPFEFTAHDINECPNSETLWEAFNEGISVGVKKGFKERFPEVFGGSKRRAKKSD